MCALRRTRRGPSFRRVSSSGLSRVQYQARLRYEPLEQRALLSLAPVLVDLQAASDSGLYADDNRTNVPTATIDITAAEAGPAIRVYREGALLGEASQVDGTLYRYVFLSGQLTEGDNPITARSFDGVEESGDSPGLVVTLDTTGPRVVGHSPEGVVAPVDSVTITFNEPIDPATLAAGDVSVSGLSLPARLGTYDTSDFARGVTISGTLAYVADYSSGLAIIDVSDPCTPTLRGTYNTSGYAYSVTVSGTLAYVADGGSGLQIIDVSNPASPTLCGTYNTSGTAYGITVSGTLAYVADYTRGLQIIDVSNPSLPVLRGTYNTSGSAYDVIVSGTLAYVADGSSGLAIIDVSNPAAPALRGTYNTSGTAYGVAVSGTLAFIADYTSGLAIIDVSNPAAPALRGIYDASSAAYGVAVSGTLAYLANGPYRLVIIDVSDPVSPTPIADCYTGGWGYDVTVSGALAYVANGASGLQVLNVPPGIVGITQMDPTTRRIVLPGALTQGTWDVFIGPHAADLAGNVMDQDADGTGGETPEDVYVFSFMVDTMPPSVPGNLAFADDTGSAGDAITSDTTLRFSWSASSDNTEIAGYEYRVDGGDWVATAELTVDVTLAEGEHVFEVRALDTVGNRSLPAATTVTVDLTPPEAPSGLGLDGSVLLWEEPADAHGIWRYEYRIDEGEWVATAALQTHTGLAEGQSALFDVRAVDPAGNTGPVANATLTADYGPYVVGHSPEGLVGPVDYLTITFNEPVEPATLTAMDVSVSSPSLPALLGTYDTSGYAYGVALSGTLAYVADGTSGLQIIDVSNPFAPALRGTCSTNGYAYDVTVFGTLACVANGASGLAIIDVSDPAAPVLRGTYDTSAAHGVTLSGTLAYVADGDSGLAIIDVSNPAAPALCSTSSTSGTACDVTVSGTLAYVADGSRGLQIIDVSNPAAPMLRGRYDTSGFAGDVTVWGTLAYVADGGSGLQIIEVSNPAAPALLGTFDTSGPAQSVTVSGTLAYMANGSSGLVIIDVSNPSQPVLVGTCDTSGNAVDAAVSGSLAFVADEYDSLEILRVPPGIVGIAQTDPTTWRINLSGALAASQYHVSIGPHVSDLSGNTMDQDADGAGGQTPNDLYTFGFTVDVTVPPLPGDLTFADNTGSTGDAVTSDTTLTFTWSEPANPWGIAGYEYRVDGGEWVATTERTAEVTLAEGQRVFEICAVDTFGNAGPPAVLTVRIDLTAPDAPAEVRLDGSVLLWQEPADAGGIWKYEYCIDGGGWTEAVTTQTQTGLPEGQSGLFQVRAIDRAGNTGPVAGATLTADYGPYVVRHTPERVTGPVDYLTVTFNEPIDPATLTPAEVKVLGPFLPALVGTYDTSGWAHAVTVSGTLAYVADDVSGLQIIDVSTPSAPVLRGTCDTSGGAGRVTVSGTLAYVGDGYSGLQIIDVSNPSAPVLRGTYNTSGSASAVTVSGTLAYVADGTSGLAIIDVSNPSAPVLRGTYNTGGIARDVIVCGTLAYVANDIDGLAIIDVSNPSAPTLRGTFDTSYAQRVTVSGTLAYVADYGSGLVIIDVSNPSAPTLRGTFDTSGNAVGVTVSGTLAYVADGDNGLVIIDVSDPSRPVLVGIYDSSGYAQGAMVSGSLAYVADFGSGLQILKVPPGIVGVAQTDSTTYRITLSGALTQGTWDVSIRPHATDLSGNTMDQDADGAGGEALGDVYTFSFIVDKTPPVPGDANRSGTVDAADAQVLASHWGLSGMTWAEGDFNNDGRVNAADAAILAANWGRGTSEAVKPLTPVAPVEPIEPEPAPAVDSPLVGPVPMDRRDAARRRVEPAARAEAAKDVLLVAPRLEPTPREAAAAADAALVEEFGPQPVEQPVERSDLSHLAVGRAAWTQTLARRHRVTDSARSSRQR